MSRYILTTSGTHEKLFEYKNDRWWILCFREAVSDTSEYGDWKKSEDPMHFEPHDKTSYHWHTCNGCYGYSEDEFSYISRNEASMILYSVENKLEAQEGLILTPLVIGQGMG